MNQEKIKGSTLKWKYLDLIMNNDFHYGLLTYKLMNMKKISAFR